MGKKKSQRFLRVFMKRFPYFESMQAGTAEYRDDVNWNMTTLVDKLRSFSQILVTSEAEVNDVYQLVETFSYTYTGEVRFPTNLDAGLKERLDSLATEKGLKVSKGYRPLAAANKE